ncbi:hypothetical protein LX32DRAFT_10560 [Colletotrichum zoysiae]|uniref:Uncharacterized protein n=1 Tax=Colletotrichum zoysiae TaxID=1216348 RepID=A0AAD9HEB2_9PEZI|nr:hypothetical protein LX32DRAFT_10560 [Colletotrichum zoysiae]
MKSPRIHQPSPSSSGKKRRKRKRRKKKKNTQISNPSVIIKVVTIERGSVNPPKKSEEEKVYSQQRSEEIWNRLPGLSSWPISPPSSGLMVTGQGEAYAKYAQSRQCQDWSQIFQRTMLQVKGASATGRRFGRDDARGCRCVVGGHGDGAV